jgi:CRP-like cAMP-binding protein
MVPKHVGLRAAEISAKSCGMSSELVSPHLPAAGLVAELSREDRDTLSSYGSFHRAVHNDVLIHQGESHGKLFFIVSGLLHARRREEERDVLLGPINPGEWVGEVDLFDPSTAVCSVVAIEETQYWEISRKDLEDFINNYPQAGIQLLVGVASMLGRRLRSVTKKLMDEAQMSVVRASLWGEG